MHPKSKMGAWTDRRWREGRTGVKASGEECHLQNLTVAPWLRVFPRFCAFEHISSYYFGRHAMGSKLEGEQPGGRSRPRRHSICCGFRVGFCSGCRTDRPRGQAESGRVGVRSPLLSFSHGAACGTLGLLNETDLPVEACLPPTAGTSPPPRGLVSVPEGTDSRVCPPGLWKVKERAPVLKRAPEGERLVSPRAHAAQWGPATACGGHGDWLMPAEEGLEALPSSGSWYFLS